MAKLNPKGKKGKFVSSTENTRRNAVRNALRKHWWNCRPSDHTYSSNPNTETEIIFAAPDLSLIEKEEVVGENGASLTEWRQGRRIVELGVLADGLSGCKMCSTPLHLTDTVSIYDGGLGSVLSVACRNTSCQFLNKVSTGKKKDKNKFDANGKLEFALKNSGLGYRQLSTLLAQLNLPPVSAAMLKGRSPEVGTAIDDLAIESTIDALEEEVRLTKELTGEDAITVSVDAAWQKRGSGRAYDSMSGHATMVGKLTGKVVGFAIRLKHCKTCEVAARKKQKPPPHDCRINWTGSAKAMEPDMVVEMVEKVKERGVTVKTLIGDEDSTTIARVRANVDKEVTKESDSNHIKKIMSNMLHNLRNTKKELSLKIISYLKKLFNYMLHDGKGKPDVITEGLTAIPNHVFGCHDFCGQWCRAKQTPDGNYVYRSLPHGKPLVDASLKAAITDVFDHFKKHADKLANLGSTQANESLNKSIASKAPKTHHFSGTANLSHRLSAAIAEKNIGPNYVTAVNERLGLSPGVYTKKLFLQREVQQKKRKAISITAKAKRRRMELKAKRSKQTVTAETREGATYSESVTLADYEDIEEIPPPKYIPKFKPMPVEDDKTTTEIYFDLETTGFERTSHITQIAVARGQDRLNLYVNPKKAIQSKASEVTGLKLINGTLYCKEKKLDSVSISAAIDKFIEFLQKSSNNVIIGHNIRAFDCHVLLHALTNCGKLQSFLQHVVGVMDTKSLFKASHPDLKKYSQKALYSSIVGTEYNAHDAMADVEALKCLVETAGSTTAMKQNNTATISHIMDCFLYCVEAQQNLPSLSALVNSKVVSKGMARTIAGSGLQMKHLMHAYRRNGRSGIVGVLQEKPLVGGTQVRVTRSKKVSDSIADYFARQDRVTSET